MNSCLPTFTCGCTILGTATQTTFKLTGNLSCPISSGDGAIIIEKNGAILDLNGFKLTGDAANQDIAGVGIFMDGVSNVKVLNGAITGFQTGIFGTGLDATVFQNLRFSEFEAALVLSASDGVTVQDSTFLMINISDGGTGISTDEVTDLTVTKNNFILQDTETTGIILDNNSNGALINLNTFSFPSSGTFNNANEFNIGIEIQDSIDTTVDSNCFFGPKSGTILPQTQGVNVDVDPTISLGDSNNVISNNSFDTLEFGVKVEEDEGTLVDSNCFTKNSIAIGLSATAMSFNVISNKFFNNDVNIDNNGSQITQPPVPSKKKGKTKGFCPCALKKGKNKGSKMSKAPRMNKKSKMTKAPSADVIRRH